MDRRGFFRGLGALLAAPAVVRVESLMQVVVPKDPLPILWGDGIHDDTVALQRLLRGEPVDRRDTPFQSIRQDRESVWLYNGIYLINQPLYINVGTRLSRMARCQVLLNIPKEEELLMYIEQPGEGESLRKDGGEVHIRDCHIQRSVSYVPQASSVRLVT